MRRLLRVLLGVVLVLALGLFVLAAFGVTGFSIGCGRVPFLVRGTVVDATTGAPVAGAALLTLFDPADVDDPEKLARLRDVAWMYEGATEEELLSPPAPVVGSARTDASGAFTIVAGFGVSTSYGPFGIEWRHERGNAFDAVRALLVERDGYLPLVHDTRAARWQEHEEGELAGTLDVGTIRLAPSAR